jgi:hypothetical protein
VPVSFLRLVISTLQVAMPGALQTLASIDSLQAAQCMPVTVKVVAVDSAKAAGRAKRVRLRINDFIGGTSGLLNLRG